MLSTTEDEAKVRTMRIAHLQELGGADGEYASTSSNTTRMDALLTARIAEDMSSSCVRLLMDQSEAQAAELE